jgi:carbon-monoxide dehydrogenase small subunit
VRSEIRFTVNGVPYSLEVVASQTLLEVLRDRLGLTGTKKGCGEGVCGACTVLIQGEPALACTVLAVRCRDKEVTTVEGLARDGELHPLQSAAVEHNAVQCGFCTPGWLLSAKALLDAVPTPTRLEVRQAISGNLCRCTGYRRIEDAILGAAASSERQEEAGR